MNCAYCGKRFPKRPWPATRAKFCSVRCNKNAWADRNKDAIKEKNRRYQQEHRDRRLLSQYRYNNSEKGRAMKRRHYDATIKERVEQYLNAYRLNPEVRKVQYQRQKSRRILLRSGISPVCKHCGAVQRLHCHHRDDNPSNMSLDNLEWLCFRCHARVHAEPLLLE